MNLIHTYDQINQFDQKPERLVDVLATLAIIGHFPENLLNKLYTKENLHQLTGIYITLRKIKFVIRHATPLALMSWSWSPALRCSSRELLS
jgi:hypothetical protein